jgi:hypothetical protein
MIERHTSNLQLSNFKITSTSAISVVSTQFPYLLLTAGALSTTFSVGWLLSLISYDFSVSTEIDLPSIMTTYSAR